MKGETSLDEILRTQLTSTYVSQLSKAKLLSAITDPVLHLNINSTSTNITAQDTSSQLHHAPHLGFMGNETARCYLNVSFKVTLQVYPGII